MKLSTAPQRKMHMMEVKSRRLLLMWLGKSQPCLVWVIPSLYWTKDPTAYKNSFWNGPSKTAQIFSYVYVAVLLIASYLIARRVFLQPVAKNYLFRANV